MSRTAFAAVPALDLPAAQRIRSMDARARCTWYTTGCPPVFAPSAAGAADFSQLPTFIRGLFPSFGRTQVLVPVVQRRKEADAARDWRLSDLPSHAGPFSDTETCFAAGPPEIAEGGPPRHASLS